MVQCIHIYVCTVYIINLLTDCSKGDILTLPISGTIDSSNWIAQNVTILSSDTITRVPLSYVTLILVATVFG